MLKRSTQELLDALTEMNAKRMLRMQLEDERRASLREREIPASIFRAVVQMMNHPGLQGPEREFGQERAREAGAGFDPHHLHLRLEDLGTRTLTAAAAGAGAELIGVDVLAPVDRLPSSAVLRAGIDVQTGLKFDTVASMTDTDASIAWMSSETAGATPGNATLGATTMQPHTAIAVVEFSEQLAYVQSPLAEPWARAVVERKAAEAIDAAVLNGSGDAPTGVLNTSGISTQSGTSFARTAALAMKKNAADANVPEESITFFGATNTQQTLEGRPNETGGGTYIWQNGMIVNCRAIASTNMPSASLLCGPFGLVTLGLFGPGIEISINPVQNFRASIVALRVEVRCDVALRCAATAFTKSTSIT
jgi:HK97 family phage major capsid protein